MIGATQVLDANLISSLDRDRHAGRARVGEGRRRGSSPRCKRRAPTADTVVVFLHWGIEGHTCPSADQEQLARTLVDAGADIVVGGHAHRLEGGGQLGAAFVDYGLGNFVFYTARGPGAQSGVVLVTVTGRDVDRTSSCPRRSATACAHRSPARPRTPRSRMERPARVAPTSLPEAHYAPCHCTTTSSACSARTRRSSASRGTATAGRARRGRRRAAASRVSALRWGDGEPEIVLLHGGAQNAHTWDTVALALDRPLVAIDLPGHGHSVHRDDHAYWPAENAVAVEAAVRELAPQDRLVVGMSLGGLTRSRSPDARPISCRRSASST